jgi:hypothetical protein
MKHASFCLQFNQLLLRAFRNVLRNPIIFRVRIGQTIMMIIVLNLLYRQLDDDEESIQNRNGLMFFICIFLAMTNMQNVLLSFPIERALFLRE